MVHSPEEILTARNSLRAEPDWNLEGVGSVQHGRNDAFGARNWRAALECGGDPYGIKRVELPVRPGVLVNSYMDEGKHGGACGWDRDVVFLLI